MGSAMTIAQTMPRTRRFTTTIHHMVGTRLAVKNHDFAPASLLKHALCLVVVARLHALFHDFSIRLSAGDDRRVHA